MTLSPGAKVQPPLYLPVPGRIQCHLEFDVERSGTDTTSSVHRTQHLYVPEGVEAEPPRDPRLNEINDARHSCFGLVCLDEVEVASVLGGLRSGIER
jgi:hypothetical protein